MNSTNLFKMALGIEFPWEVTNIKLSEEATRKELHISIDFKRGSKFADETGELCEVHDTVEKTWRHLNFLSMHVIYIVEFLESKLKMVKLN